MGSDPRKAAERLESILDADRAATAEKKEELIRCLFERAPKVASSRYSRSERLRQR